MGFFRDKNINKAALAVLVAGLMLSGCVEQPTAYGADKVLVCHKGKTLVIPETALGAHLGHGDTRGACSS